MSKGLQILPLGILFQRLHHSIKFWTKNQFYHFWWLAPEISENHFVTQILVKNQEPDIHHEIE